MVMWQSIFQTTLTSLLSGLVIVAIAALLNLRFAGKRLYEILLNRKKLVIFSLVLLILLMPLVLSLLRGARLSPREWGVYTRELLLSVVIVVSFAITWVVLNDPARIRRWLKAIFKAPIPVTISPRPDVNSMPVQSPGLATYLREHSQTELYLSLQAFEHDEIAQSDVEELQQALSLRKWFQEGDVTGWRELYEDAKYGDGLSPDVLLLLQQEYKRVRQTRYRVESRPTGYDDYKKRLKLLLQLAPIE